MTVTIRRVAAGAALLAGAAVRAGAQEPPTTCGPSMRRAPAMRVEVDSLLRTRSVLELQRLTGELQARGVVGGGRVQIGTARGWLGIRTSEVSEIRIGSEGRLVRYCDYPVVVSVEPASPAAQAGVEAGDTIVAYNGADLRTAGEVALDRLLVPGDTLRVALRREGRPITAPVVVGRAPAMASTVTGGPGFSYVIVGPGQAPVAIAPFPATNESPEARARAVVRRTREPSAVMPSLATTPFALGFALGGPSTLAGAQLIAMDEDLRAVVGAKSGVLVLKVAEGTPASEAGLRSGDVIVRADGQAVHSPIVVQQALLRNRGDRAVPLKVERRGKTRDVVLRW